jgi:hypothetical protein
VRTRLRVVITVAVLLLPAAKADAIPQVLFSEGFDGVHAEWFGTISGPPARPNVPRKID